MFEHGGLLARYYVPVVRYYVPVSYALTCTVLCLYVWWRTLLI